MKLSDTAGTGRAEKREFHGRWKIGKERTLKANARVSIGIGCPWKASNCLHEILFACRKVKKVCSDDWWFVRTRCNTTSHHRSIRSRSLQIDLVQWLVWVAAWISLGRRGLVRMMLYKIGVLTAIVVWCYLSSFVASWRKRVAAHICRALLFGVFVCLLVGW